MCTRFISSIRFVIALFVCCATIIAHAETRWDFLLSAERTHQSFEDTDADLDEITFTPTFSVDNFSFTATLPWQRRDGLFFLDTTYPNLASLCSLIDGLSALQKYRLIRAGSLTLAQVRYCNNYSGTTTSTEEDNASGAGDVELFASYYLPPFTESASASLGVGYKHDNGDWESGLGSGTRDLYAEAALLLQTGPLHLLLTLGYNGVQHDATGLDPLDYGYSSLDAGLLVLEALTLGLEYHYQQANTDVTDDLEYLVWYGEVELPAGFGGRLFLTDYLDADNLPQEEFGGSLSWHF